MTPATSPRTVPIFCALALLAVGGAVAAYLLAPEVPNYDAIEGRPLLEQDGPYFTDHQVGFQFTPPAGWGLQMRSTEAPTAKKPERTIVKYKRLVRGPRVAWLRVSVADAAEGVSPAEVLKTRKPRESNFTVSKPVEDGLSVDGRPAARVTFTGLLNPDSLGERPCTSEVVAVQHGKQMLYFTATFATADAESKEMLRTAIESTIIDPKRFLRP
ncbi:MAG: hypothetical protein K1X57_17050 [Gemmataceae bacterium]|nr:hypothetical protein [Gemmataceae bacterium]